MYDGINVCRNWRKSRRNSSLSVSYTHLVVGKEGVITVEESKTMNTELETVEGMQFDRGFVSAYMVTDVDKMEAVLNDPYILIDVYKRQGKWYAYHRLF